MISDEPFSRDEADVADLVDKVMRGQVALPVPPGTLAFALVIPCFAVATTSISMGLALTISRSLSAVYGGCAAALALLAYALVGQVLVITGRVYARHWLLKYARILMIGVAASVAGARLCGLRTPWASATLSFAALVACDRLLGSRAYFHFSAFMSLKRRYRADVKAASARVLDRQRR